MKQEIATIDPQTNKSLVRKLGERYGVDADKLLATLKATAFKVKDGEVSNEQMLALLVVADQFKLNPFTKEIYAFADRNGIVPVVGVDGWSRIINEHPQFDGMSFEQDDERCACTIYRKDRTHSITVTEYYAECKRDTGPWKSHPKRMLRHKAMIQCARLAFGFVGFFDPDEAERIIDVTPPKNHTTLAEITKRNDAPSEVVDTDTGEVKEPDIPLGLAVKALQDATTKDDVKKAHANVVKAYKAANMEIPIDVETVYLDRLKELSKR